MDANPEYCTSERTAKEKVRGIESNTVFFIASEQFAFNMDMKTPDTIETMSTFTDAMHSTDEGIEHFRSGSFSESIKCFRIALAALSSSNQTPTQTPTTTTTPTSIQNGDRLPFRIPFREPATTTPGEITMYGEPIHLIVIDYSDEKRRGQANMVRSATAVFNLALSHHMSGIKSKDEPPEVNLKKANATYTKCETLLSLIEKRPFGLPGAVYDLLMMATPNNLIHLSLLLRESEKIPYYQKVLSIRLESVGNYRYSYEPPKGQQARVRETIVVANEADVDRAAVLIQEQRNRFRKNIPDETEADILVEVSHKSSPRSKRIDLAGRILDATEKSDCDWVPAEQKETMREISENWKTVKSIEAHAVHVSDQEVPSLVNEEKGEIANATDEYEIRNKILPPTNFVSRVEVQAGVVADIEEGKRAGDFDDLCSRSDRSSESGVSSSVAFYGSEGMAIWSRLDDANKLVETPSGEVNRGDTIPFRSGSDVLDHPATRRSSFRSGNSPTIQKQVSFSVADEIKVKNSKEEQHSVRGPRWRYVILYAIFVSVGALVLKFLVFNDDDSHRNENNLRGLHSAN